MNVIVNNITQQTSLFTAIGYSIIVIVCTILGWSYFLSWKIKSYRLLIAQALFLFSLVMNFSVAAITSWAFYIDPTHIYVAPFIVGRVSIIAIASLYLFYALWWKNGKVEKLARSVEDVSIK